MLKVYFLLKQLIPSIKGSIIIFLLIGAFSSSLEVWAVFELQNNFSNYHNNSMQALNLETAVILLIAFVCGVILSQLGMYFATYQAYMLSAALINSLLLQTNVQNYTAISGNITRLVVLERDKFAREVLSQIFIISIKFAQPVVLVIFLIHKYGLLSAFVLGFIFTFYVIVSLLFGSIFKKNAFLISRLSSQIAKRSEELSSSSKIRVRKKMLNFGFQLQDDIKKSAIGESIINIVSQAPRILLDVLMLISLLIYLLFFKEAGLVQIADLVLIAPIISRTATAVQQIYKSIANIRSNENSILFIENIANELISNADVREFKSAGVVKNILRIGYVSDLKSLAVTSDGLGEYKASINFIKTLGISAPSGFGKTVAIERVLGFNNPHNIKNQFKIEIDGLSLSDVGYIQSDSPVIQEVDFYLLDNSNLNSIEFEVYSRLKLNEISIESLRSGQLSTGEKFRISVLREIRFGSRLIIIDESIANINQYFINVFFTLVEEGFIPPVIIISHMSEIIDRLEYTFKLT